MFLIPINAIENLAQDTPCQSPVSVAPILNKTLVIYATHDNEFAMKADKILNIQDRNVKAG